MTPGWPARLSDGPVGLRPLRLRDASAWREVRSRNASWLRPWEATGPLDNRDVPHTYGAMVRRLRAEAREGRGLPFALTYEGRFVGQVTVGGIARGSLMSGYVGYWIDQARAGRGLMPEAVVVVARFAFEELHLHRLEVCIIPRNSSSRRVVEKLGIREEGVAERFLEINGTWEDHVRYGITIEEWNDRREWFLGEWLDARVG